MSLSILYSFPHRLGIAGIGNTAWQQVAGLAAKGVNVTLACGTCERPVPGVHRVIETMRVAGLKIPYRLIGHRRVFARHDHIVARTLTVDGRGFGAVHCWPGASIETLAAAGRVGVPSFLERPNTHTAFAFEAVAREHKHIGFAVPADNTHAFDRDRLAIEEREYAAAGTLLCPSDFVASTFLDRGYGRDKIALHQYGCDTSLFHPAAPGAAAPDRPLAAVFVGRCEPRKGLHYALQAWHDSGAAAMPGARFKICGSFMDGYREHLSRWLDHPSVEVIGFSDDVPAVMRGADVFILPALEEGSALVTYEARASGNVLLVSDAAGARVEHGVNGLVHPAGNLGDLTGHLRRVAESRGFLEALRSSSLADREALSWAMAADRLIAIYRARRCAMPAA